MPLKKGKSPGWAAIDLKQQREHNLFPAVDLEPYPPIPTPTSVSSLRPCENLMRTDDSSARPYSSLLLPYTDFSKNKDCRKVIHAGDSSGKHDDRVVVDVLFHRKLKGIHSWADDGLIEDVLAATNNHIDKASSLLKAMAFTGTSKGNDKTDVVQQIHCSDNFPSGKDINTCIPVRELNFTLKDHMNDNEKESMDEYASTDENSSNDVVDAKVLVGNSRAIPVEPEWIDDDIDMYLNHRKDAIRMMRLASQHSRAATNAYQRGDHFAAQQHSLKAQEERIAAERLNSEAAKEILNIRNIQNDVWKLDLHGLHAAEAVQALQGHLLKIETQLPLNRSVSPNKLKMDNNNIKRSSSLESFSCMDLGRLEKLQVQRRARLALSVWRCLEVLASLRCSFDGVWSNSGHNRRFCGLCDGGLGWLFLCGVVWRCWPPFAAPSTEFGQRSLEQLWSQQRLLWPLRRRARLALSVWRCLEVLASLRCSFDGVWTTEFGATTVTTEASVASLRRCPAGSAAAACPHRVCDARVCVSRSGFL